MPSARLAQGQRWMEQEDGAKRLSHSCTRMVPRFLGSISILRDGVR